MNIQFLTPHTLCQDARGSIMGIVNDREWREVNYIFTLAGVTRGNHYHKLTHELIFIVKGSARVEFISVDDPDDKEVFSLEEGRGVIVPLRILHTLYYESDTVHVSLLDRPIDPKNPDFHLWGTT